MTDGGMDCANLDLTVAIGTPGCQQNSTARKRRATQFIDPDRQISSPKTIVGVGSSFLKMFVGNCEESVFLPRGYTVEPEHLSSRWFSITAPTGSIYKVWMEPYLDSLVMRAGWPDLFESEAVEQGDIGLFTRTGPLTFSLTLMTRGGMQKAPADPDLLRHLPDKRLSLRCQDVKFYRSKGVMRSPKLLSLLQSLWVSCRHPFILYASYMTDSAILHGTLLLSKDVSAKLPNGPETIGLVFNGSRLMNDGIIVKNKKQVAKIHGEWIHFARANGIHAGQMYVFKFEIREAGWQVTLYEV